MCDDHTEADNDRLLTRRAFGAGAGAFGLSALLPAAANAAEVAGREVTVETPDGRADAYYVAPARGRHPAVLVWPDIGGLRPAFRQMADRLAGSGYAVLTVNPFYRSVQGPAMQAGESFTDPVVRDRLTGWRARLTPEATVRDATAFAAFLDAQPQVNRRRGMGTTGYCMGGPLVMRTAAALPARVRAGASFHGGGLATDAPDSPHLLVPRMRGQFLFAVAANDDQRNPAEKDRLRSAFAAAQLPAEIEVYAGTLHGWCPPDSRAYNAAQADRAWSRLLALFGRALVND